ncbi:PAAR domain-containing protein [Acidimangrovimonas sediminis]|uniref:PAAR domain-containing protein n=1 Tax=Acidimangrovimonas sediminis TaxID=2056283 RepID=UPI0018EB12D8|nr:PAAR domain-containing protein [Acidimangrovimonas sediminis]
MPGLPAARLTDMHTCPMCMGATLPILPACQPNVLVGKLPAARMGDLCACVGPPPAAVDAIIFGSPTVLIGGRPAARLGDPTAKGGAIMPPCLPTVLIGMAGAMGPPGMQVLPPICIRLSADAARLAQAQNDAMMAGAAYGGADAPLPPNTARATDEDLEALGLKDGDMDLTRIPDSDFRSDVFVHTDPVTGEKDYTIAFKGTSPLSGEDWETNVKQGLGKETPYYNRAMQIGQTAETMAPGRVRFTGHSLGGGMASAASAVSGAPGSTFNAAGLNPATTERFGKTLGDVPMEAYYVEGDILSAGQDNTPLPDAVGTRRPLAPAKDSAWTDYAGAAAGGIAGGFAGGFGGAAAGGAAGGSAARGGRLHLMSSVNEALEKAAKGIYDTQVANGCL